MTTTLSFQREKDEDILLQNHETKHEKQDGTLTLTTKKVEWSRTGSVVPQFVIRYTEIKNLQVSPIQKSKRALLKIVTLNDTATIIEFTSAQCWTERDTVRDIIAPLLPSKPTSSTTTNKPATSPTPTPAAAVPTTPITPPAQQKPTANGTAKLKAKQIISNDTGTALQTPIPVDIEQEASQRAALLAGNRELKTLHDELVKSGAITEEEFWENHKTMLLMESMKPAKQPRGMPSAMLADLRPYSETCNAVRYKLTPAIIHQIFLEHPSVHDAYLQNVPDKMTEQQFWTKYFQSRYFHRELGRPKTAAEIDQEDIFAKCAEQDEREAADPSRLASKLKDLSPVVDLSAAEIVPTGQGYGVPRGDEQAVAVATAGNITLIRRVNRHGELVITSEQVKRKQPVPDGPAAAEPANGADTEAPPTKRRKEWLHESTRLEDLETEPAPAYIPLQIQDPRVYFERHADALASSAALARAAAVGTLGTSALNMQDVLKAFREEVEGWRSDYTRLEISNDLAQQILSEVTPKAVMGSGSASSAVPGAAVRDVVSVNMPEQFQRELFQVYSAANELLRHFWASFPITTQKLKDKVSRVAKSILELREKIQKMQEDLLPEQRSQLAPILFPILTSLDRAREKYESRSLFM